MVAERMQPDLFDLLPDQGSFPMSIRHTKSLKLARPITPDEFAAYNQVGVVLLRGVLDLATVNQIRRGIDEAVSTLNSSPAGYDYSQLTTAYQEADKDLLARESQGQHNVAAIVEHMRASGDRLLFDDAGGRSGRFMIDTGVTARLNTLRRLALHGCLPEIPAALLGSKEVRFFGDQMFVKEPGTRERTAFHQDATYFPIDGQQCCVLWVPTDPVTAETGAMQYVRGSHKTGKLYKPNVFVSQTPLPGAEGELLPDIEGHPEDFDVVSFDVEPGDVLVHHYKTVHGAGGNLSRYQVRRAISIRYCGDDIRVVDRPWAPAQLHQRHPLAPGAALSGPDYPIVWLRNETRTAA